MTRIENKAELKYIMDFYGLKQIPIREDKKDLGVVTNNMEYKGGSWHYNKGYEYIAFDKAIERVNKDMQQIEGWRNVAKQTFRTKLIYKSESSHYAEKKYTWESDIKDSGVQVEYDEKEDALIFVGNINQLRKFLSYATNHWRYCNGTTYYYENEELRNLMQFFRDYDMYAAYDSFMEYYHGGIVD